MILLQITKHVLNIIYHLKCQYLLKMTNWTIFGVFLLQVLLLKYIGAKKINYHARMLSFHMDSLYSLNLALNNRYADLSVFRAFQLLNQCTSILEIEFKNVFDLYQKRKHSKFINENSSTESAIFDG